MVEGNRTKTTHKVIFGDSQSKNRPRGKVDLCVTSPPYPMVSMWDPLFSESPEVASALKRLDGEAAFEMMHASLDVVWAGMVGQLKEGGMACINVGDATRTIGDSFRVYPNHVRVEGAFQNLGLSPLPEILWRKTSNKPNKFMGSGMLPPGAYVTQEHEYILLFRKGERRRFDARSAQRARSSYFWEERNRWFSDVWEDLKGERQTLLASARARKASFPFELPYRLVSMFSIQGDTVFDPFLGTGTSVLAAMAAARSSLSVEIDPGLRAVVRTRLLDVVESANRFNKARLRRHALFAASRKDLGYKNANYGFRVMTGQETSLELPRLESVSEVGEDVYEVEYSDEPLSIDGTE